MSDITANFHMNSDTSVAAFNSTPGSHRQVQRTRIYEKIGELNGATCSEIESLLGLSHQTASARITELQKYNRIFDTGERRLTQLGKKARVYKIL
jgi:hypothetical protein